MQDSAMSKENNLNLSNKVFNFWICAGLLALLLASILARDITRPIYGLHSWAEAHGNWLARAHVNYGLDYTEWRSTWAVGNPPIENPKRYLDHPPLPVLLRAVGMAVFGVNDWQHRVVKLTISIISLLLFLKLMRNLLDDETTLLAGLFLVLFPVTGYFSIGGFHTPFILLGMWCYFTLTGTFREPEELKKWHKSVLAITLFLVVQFNWTGFFYAMAFGVHYVARCVFRKQLPNKTILAILVIAPLSSLALNFTIMAAGYDWDIQKIVDLFIWRSSGTGKSNMQGFPWGAWFAKFWEFAGTNFSMPVLITTILYLTFGQLLVFYSKDSLYWQTTVTRRFPQFWFFLMPGMFQLLILKNALWPHQTWEKPLWPVFAISTALGVMMLRDILKKTNRHVANVGTIAIVTVIAGFCFAGTNYYYSIRWQSPVMIKMLKDLNKNIPPDEALLSYQGFKVMDHPAKGAHYRPEIAWYLDREIVQAKTMEEIQRFARTGNYPYYLIPQAKQLKLLIDQLMKQYRYQFISGHQGEKTKEGKFLKAGMIPYLIFNLRTAASMK